MTTAVQPPEVDDPTKRPLPIIEELQAWSELGETALTARINDLLEHAEEYQHLVDPRSYRQGLEDGVVAVMAAMEPTLEERNDGTDGVGVVWIYMLCQGLGLDSVPVITRVAAATRDKATEV